MGERVADRGFFGGVGDHGQVGKPRHYASGIAIYAISGITLLLLDSW
jgi:hypothetical protein